ncbi:MAG: ArsR/SmtB family transcription factor [Thermoprotei archaeon]
MKRVFRLSEIFEELKKYGKCKLSEIPIDVERVVEIPPENVSDIARILKNLGEPSKLRILLLLRNGPLPVCVISYTLELDQTLVSHHMKSLRKSGLIESIRAGKFKLYKLTEQTRELLDTLLELVAPHEIQ